MRSYTRTSLTNCDPPSQIHPSSQGWQPTSHIWQSTKDLTNSLFLLSACTLGMKKGLLRLDRDMATWLYALWLDIPYFESEEIGAYELKGNNFLSFGCSVLSVAPSDYMSNINIWFQGQHQESASLTHTLILDC